MKKSIILLFIASILVITILVMNCQQPLDSSGGGGVVTTPIDYNAMVTIPAITNFVMGYGTSADTLEHTVPTISSFKIGKYEVTYDRWYTVYQWAILPAHGYTFGYPGREGNDGTEGAAPTSAKNEPAVGISWRDCIVWCNAASQYEGLTPVYYTNAGFTILLKVSTDNTTISTTAGSEDNPYVNWSANGYRLPTEAEWEASARYQNGTIWTPGNYASGATADYNNAAATGAAAWYSANNGNVTHVVGTKNANQAAIYDMSGNIGEWCWDWYGYYTTSSPYTDNNPKGHSYDPASTYRVIRGGSWLSAVSFLPCSSRDCGWPCDGQLSYGFRLSRTN